MNAVPILLAAALVFVAAAAPAAEESPPAAAGAPPTVAVVGQASEDAKPDVATISLSIEVEKPTAAEASGENARRAEAVIAGLAAAGIAAKDIATVGLSLYPVWNSQGQTRSASGYQAINRIAVRVQPLDKAAALIAEAVQNGAEYQGLSFDVADREAREDALRTKAVENAAHRAELYARGAAMKLGTLQAIHVDAAQPAYRPLMELARVGSGAAKPPPIEPGLITLTETVSASWALAPE
jgi:hypothetical protein